MATPDQTTSGPNATGSTVVGMFLDAGQAAAAVEALAAAGFGPDRTSVAARNGGVVLVAVESGGRADDAAAILAAHSAAFGDEPPTASR